jgi:hypothetical protein
VSEAKAPGLALFEFHLVTAEKARGVSRGWGDKDGTSMTGRVFAGWGIVDGVGFAVGRDGV